MAFKRHFIFPNERVGLVGGKKNMKKGRIEKKPSSTLHVLLVVLFLDLRNLFMSKTARNHSFPQKIILLVVSWRISIVFPFVVLKKIQVMRETVQSKFTAKSSHLYQNAFSHEEIGMWFPMSGAANEGYTTVHTVLSVVSNLTALASVGFMFVSYMGFSNDACPFVFSCPA